MYFIQKMKCYFRKTEYVQAGIFKSEDGREVKYPSKYKVEVDFDTPDGNIYTDTFLMEDLPKFQKIANRLIMTAKRTPLEVDLRIDKSSSGMAKVWLINLNKIGDEKIVTE